MNYAQMLDALEKDLTAKRFRHSWGVSQTAERLALRHGLDAAQASIAGLLHDCARELSKKELLSTAEAFGIVMNDVERAEPVLLHAPIAAHWAAEKYGVTDQAVCQAIAVHTVGAKTMSPLDKVLYLADMIEPGRQYPGVEELRVLADIDLDQALLSALEQSIRYILQGGGLLHPATIEARNSLLLQQRQR